MVAEVFSAMIQGIEGQIVKIQVDISNGLPNFNMIGYLSNEVKESKERVRTALNNIGVLLPPKRISVNFAPADFRKCGTSFDIGVAAAILLAMDFVPETYIKDTLFVGELSLNGQICPISGVLPIVVAASKRGIKRCIVAQENVAEAAFVEQMEVVGCRNLEELFLYLKHGYIREFREYIRRFRKGMYDTRCQKITGDIGKYTKFKFTCKRYFRKCRRRQNICYGFF